MGWMRRSRYRGAHKEPPHHAFKHSAHPEPAPILAADLCFLPPRLGLKPVGGPRGPLGGVPRRTPWQVINQKTPTETRIMLGAETWCKKKTKSLEEIFLRY
jgi:hypothetical protein